MSPCSDSLSLRLPYSVKLAIERKSLTHYAKGTQSPLRAPTVCMYAVSGSISLPSPDRSGEPERNYPQGLPLRVTLETDDLRFVGLYSSGIQRLRQRGDCLRPPELPAAFAESVLASALRL